MKVFYLHKELQSTLAGVTLSECGSLINAPVSSLYRRTYFNVSFTMFQKLWLILGCGQYLDTIWIRPKLCITGSQVGVKLISFWIDRWGSSAKGLIVMLYSFRVLHVLRALSSQGLGNK